MSHGTARMSHGSTLHQSQVAHVTWHRLRMSQVMHVIRYTLRMSLDDLIEGTPALLCYTLTKLYRQLRLLPVNVSQSEHAQ